MHDGIETIVRRPDAMPATHTETTAKRPSSTTPIDRVIARSSILEVGTFSAPIDHPRFNDTGPIDKPIFVFPRTTVSIQHADADPFIADPTMVTYYNGGQVYRREPVSARGDRCEWFAFDPAVIQEVVAALDPAVKERPERPYRLQRGPCDPRSCLLERLVVRHLKSNDTHDALLVEEVMLDVLAHILRLAYAAADGTTVPPETARRRRDAEIAARVKDVLADRFCEPLSLTEIAAAVEASVGHVARAFKRHTGETIHGYRNSLRLTRALDLIAAGPLELLPVALEVGYSSHSHFTDAFRRAFGVTPSEYRRSASARRLRRYIGRTDAAYLPTR